MMSKNLNTNFKIPRRISDPVVRARRVNSYSCECGKKYSAFPALYLHFKRVHKIRISTKVSDFHRELVETDTLRAYTYFYSGPQKENEEAT